MPLLIAGLFPHALFTNLQIFPFIKSNVLKLKEFFFILLPKKVLNLGISNLEKVLLDLGGLEMK